MIKFKHIKYGSCILYNLIRLSLKSILCLGRAKFGKIQLIRPGVRMMVDGPGSSLTINRANILSGTLIQAEGGKLYIGNKVFINRNCNIIAQKDIMIDDECTIGPNVCIYDHDHAFGTKRNENEQYKRAGVIIGKRVWIGANAIILRGTTIGDDCVIGAGTIIKGNIPSKKVVVQDKILRYYDIE
jgi:acetyltransferase-like isoleucine patch superfamily enzyme